MEQNNTSYQDYVIINKHQKEKERYISTRGTNNRPGHSL